jgi:UDP-GlcNAc:undecaprenyl-phosphate GlcNAc-1-phosphate transferase
MDVNWVCLALGFTATTICIVLMRPLAARWGLVDKPGGRKQHNGNVPLIGGAAIFTVFIGCWAMLHIDWPVWMPIYLAAGGVLVATGIIDDRYDLGPRRKLLVQALCTVAVMVHGHLMLDNLGDLLGQGGIDTGALAWPLTIFAVVGVTNAINMFDGANGLAGGTALISMLGLSIAASATGAQSANSALLLLAGALASFLFFNYRVRDYHLPLAFLGDAGALFLGFTFAFVAIFLTQRTGAHLPPIVAVWIGGLPLLEIARLVFRRLVHGANPLRADRAHVHHILLALGLPERSAVAVIWLAQGVLVTVGLAAWSAGGGYEQTLFYGCIGLFAAYGLALEAASLIIARRSVIQHSDLQKALPEPLKRAA